MRIFLTSFIIFYFFTNILFAADECSAAAVEPIIKKESTNLKNYKSSYEEKYYLKEFFYIGGKKVELTHGGCEHYYFSFSFEIAYKKRTNQEIAKLAYEKIKSLHNISRLKFNDILQLLQKASKDKNFTIKKSLSYINGYDEMYLKLVKINNEKMLLVITQSLTL